MSALSRRRVFAAAASLPGFAAVAPAVPAQPAVALPGLAALAATLGELEPPGEDDDILDVHLDRQDVLAAAAPILPVTCAADAALALSVAASTVNQFRTYNYTEAELYAGLGRAELVLGQLARWIAAQGAPPLVTVWTSAASPFPTVEEVT